MGIQAKHIADVIRNNTFGINDDDCGENEEECFAAHPIHLMSMSNGKVRVIYADVDGLADLLARELWGEQK